MSKVAACEFKTLKPHPTDVELAVEQESAQKYCRNNPELIRQLSDPWECPIEFLPWLAWSLSVDVWNERWSEQAKRTVCEHALPAHAHKGTQGGLEDALSSLGVRVEITEWHEQVPEGVRGTMSLMLWINENVNTESSMMIDGVMINDLLATIDSTKRLSIHYTFSMGVESVASVGVGLSAQLGAVSLVSAKSSASAVSRPVGLVSGLSAQLGAVSLVSAKSSASAVSRPVGLVSGLSAQIMSFMMVEAIL